MPMDHFHCMSQCNNFNGLKKYYDINHWELVIMMIIMFLMMVLKQMIKYQLNESYL